MVLWCGAAGTISSPHGLVPYVMRQVIKQWLILTDDAMCTWKPQNVYKISPYCVAAGHNSIHVSYYITSTYANHITHQSHIKQTVSIPVV